MSEFRSQPSLKRVDYVSFAIFAMLPSLVLWFCFQKATGIRLEDALITYRYAENIALGNGFVFNLGERVLGTTTPLYTLILAAAGFVFGTASIPVVSSILSALLGQFAGFITFATLRRMQVSRLVSLITALILLTQPEVIVAATGGMETMLVIALMTGSLYALAMGSSRVAIALCALLVLTRIDGVVWTSVVFLLILWRERKNLLARILQFSLILLPWFAFATIYFGSPVPNSVAAKRTVIYARIAELTPMENLSAHLRWFVQVLGPRRAYQWDFFGDEPQVPNFAIMTAVVILLVCGIFAIARRVERRTLAALVLFPVALLVAYWIGSAPRRFDWYLVPPLWCCTAVVGLGLEPLLAIVRRKGQGWATRSALAIPPAIMLALLAFNSVEGHVSVSLGHGRNQALEDNLRTRVGTWLESNSPAGASVAMEAIGYQGTHAQRRIIDLAGLISPEVVRINSENPNRSVAFHQILVELKPDYLVLRSFEVATNENWFGGALFENEGQQRYFHKNYRVAQRFSAEDSKFWGRAGHLTIFARDQ